MDHLPPSPHATYLNASVQEVLMIEMVNLAYSLVDKHNEHKQLAMDGPITPRSPRIDGSSQVLEDDDMSDSELLESKLESIGYRVGHGLIERFSHTVPLTALQSDLDMIKFICKDLWTLLFNKQIDNLKTNHRGVYVLVDNSFRWFSKMSLPLTTKDQKRTSSGSVKDKAHVTHSPYLWYPCGLIRGALANLGAEAVVIAESPNGFPGVTFQIKMAQKE